MSGWTEDRIAALKAGWAAGLSAGEIAARLQHEFSRNAVIGKIHRLGLTGTGGRSKDKPARSNGGAKRMTAKRSAMMFRKAPEKTAKGKRVLIPPAEKERQAAEDKAKADAARAATEQAIADGPLIEVLDLQSHHCRWPVSRQSPHRFCGLPKASGTRANGTPKPYCDTHWRMGNVGVSRRADRQAAE